MHNYKNNISTNVEFLNKKIENYLKEIRYNYCDSNVSEIQFYSISTENENPIFSNEPNYDITLLIGLNSDFNGGSFIFLNEEVNKNLHMDNSPGDMIIYFSNIKHGNNKIISGTKYYLKININNVLNSNIPKSLI